MVNIPVEDRFTLSLASENDRQVIYTKRYSVYAEELKQHRQNASQQLKDELDDFNIYLIAKHKHVIVGFISITPSGSAKFSVDKYVSRSSFPFAFDNEVFEIRLLTVDIAYRNSALALLLMYAAMRWIENHGGKTIVAICKSDLIGMYTKAGLRPLGFSIKSGEVNYELSVASLNDLKFFEVEKKDLFASLKNKIKWDLPFPFANKTCYHGGAFFKAIGEHLQTLDKHTAIINADVLDAWFPPSPKVIEAITEHLPWLLQTSPPTHADGLIDAIAEARKINRNYILAGAGSSSLIFLGLQYFLNRSSKVLILDPCYGEYVHVLDNVIGCKVTRFKLLRRNNFVVNMGDLLEEMGRGYDMVIIVNPNSPTGQYVSKNEMQEFLKHCSDTLVWVDETYIEYVGEENSLEQFAAEHKHLLICKSMSKVYALSGARSAYLVCDPMHINALKALTPPWSISLPAQVAAIAALKDDEYYQRKCMETLSLKHELIERLYSLGIEEIIGGVANFILFFLPGNFPAAKEFVENCKKHNLFLRDVTNMGTTLGEDAIRIAVKDGNTNNKMISIMRQVVNEHQSVN